MPESNIFKEKFTGTTTARPVFMKLQKKLKAGDTLTVVKLDRLARNTREALNLIYSFRKRGITLNVLNMGRIDNTPTGKLTFTIISAFADFERDLIVSRTQEGKEFAKKHNPKFREGRPRKYTDVQLKTAYRLRQEHNWTMNQTAKYTHISTATLYRAFSKINNYRELKGTGEIKCKKHKTIKKMK